MDYLPQFGQNVGQEMPQDDSMMQLELQRRLKFADALRQQQMPEGQMISGHYVAPSFTQALAGLANKYVAGKQEQGAMKQFSEYQKGKQAKLADLLAGKEVTAPMDYNEAGNMPGMMQTTRQPYNQQEFMAKAISAMPELAPQLIQNQMSQYNKEEAPISLGEGGVLVNRKGEVIASNPKAIKPEKPTAPVVRNMRVGNQDVTQQWDADKGTWTEVARGNAFKPGGDNEAKAPSGYRFNPNGTLEAIKGGPADKPLKSAPPTVLSAYQGNNQTLAQLDEAIAAVDKAPDKYFGLQGGFGDAYMQRLYPESTDARGKYFGVAAAKRHDITGAAMSATEAPDLRPFLPSATDTKAAAKTKLRNLRNEVLKNNSIMEAMYGDTSTYAPLPNVQKVVAPSNEKVINGITYVQDSQGWHKK